MLSIKLLILMSVMIAGLSISELSQAADFSKMDTEKVIEAVKKLDKQITQVQLQTGEGHEMLIIKYRALVSPDPLLQESKNLMNITRKVVTSKGSERFAALLYVLMIPSRDEHNNPIDGEGVQLSWSMHNLKKINWKGLQNWQFLDLAEWIIQGPMGAGVIKAYCGEGRSFSEGFCKKVHPEITQ